VISLEHMIQCVLTPGVRIVPLEGMGLSHCCGIIPPILDPLLVDTPDEFHNHAAFHVGGLHVEEGLNEEVQYSWVWAIFTSVVVVPEL
jgi:hypothetical protein